MCAMVYGIAIAVFAGSNHGVEAGGYSRECLLLVHMLGVYKVG